MFCVKIFILCKEFFGKIIEKGNVYTYIRHKHNFFFLEVTLNFTLIGYTSFWGHIWMKLRNAYLLLIQEKTWLCLSFPWIVVRVSSCDKVYLTIYALNRCDRLLILWSFFLLPSTKKRFKKNSLLMIMWPVFW